MLMEKPAIRLQQNPYVRIGNNGIVQIIGFYGYVCKHTINIYVKAISKSAKHIFNTRQQTRSTIIKQFEKQSSKQMIKHRQTNMVKHRQQTWSTLVKTHNRKSSKTCKWPRLLHAMHVNMHV
jgi:hypothetical protein